MLRKYLTLFVLVMIMVKTNAQQPFFYFHGQKVQLHESNDKMMIYLDPQANMGDISSLKDKITQDPDFSLATSGYDGFYVLKRKSGSIISKENAINRYINDPGVGYVSFVFDHPDGTFRGMTNIIAAKSKKGFTKDDVANAAKEYGMKSIQQSPFDNNLYYMMFPEKSNLSNIDIANAMYETGNFDFVQPAFMVESKNNGYTSATCPSGYTTPLDPYYKYQWALDNEGATTFSIYPVSFTPHEDIDICNGWHVTPYEGSTVTLTGSGVNVAVIDDGIDVLHPDLTGNIPLSSVSGVYNIGYDATRLSSPASAFYLPCDYCTGSTDYPGAPSFLNNHGTQCAGIIAAQQNTIGITGVAPDAKLLPIRMWLYNYAMGGAPCPAWLAGSDIWTNAAIEWAWQNSTQYYADVINCSWQWDMVDNLIDAAISDAVTYGRGGKGCVIIFSSGNDNNSQINWPASEPNVIAVGASTMCGTRKSTTSCDGETWWGSNYGYGSGYGTPGSHADGFLSVVAPGVDVYTTSFAIGWYDSHCNPHSDEYDEAFDGTSAAAPQVAGIAALMLQANPCLRWDEVKDIIELTADKVGGYGYAYSMPNGLWDPEMGYGRVNAGKAVTLAHDIYKQDKNESGTVVYSGPHKIFAGYDVTDILSLGNYTLQNLSNVTFKAAEAIVLAPGFKSSYSTTNSVFLGEIQNTCNMSDAHFRKAMPTNNSNSPIPVVATNDITDVKIYPNPVKNILNISYTLPQDENVTICLTNVLGQLLKRIDNTDIKAGTQLQTISTHSLTPGVYLITIKTQNGFSKYKFVKD